jgi:hypothetical protein
MAAAAKHIIRMGSALQKSFPCRNRNKGGGLRLNMIGLAVPLVDLANFAAGRGCYICSRQSAVQLGSG